jgi:hypothetical protein
MSTPTENFSLVKVNNLCVTDAQEYLTKYFIPLSDGNHAFYLDGKHTIVDQKVIKHTYFNRMSKELNDFYFKKYTGIKSVVYKFQPEALNNDELNLCPEMKSKKKPFASYDENTRNAVFEMLDFMKVILASNDQNQYQYLIKWFANMLKGKKNDACLYLKGEQGIGKSTLFDFIQFHVIGDGLYLQTGSEPMKSKFNAILGGKLFVVFEELESFSTNEWSAISSVLKRYITEKSYVLEAKYGGMYQTQNMNNYAINSNNDSIRDDDGRRFYILDVSHLFKNNREYFKKLRDRCFNDNVGEAFYNYMIEVDTEGFIPQNYPMTKSKLISHIKRLPKEYDFIKQNYILKNLGINSTPKVLYNLYKEFCSKKPLIKSEFITKLSIVGICHRKTNGNNYYKYSFEELKKIGEELHWLHETDDYEDVNEQDDNNVVDQKDNIIESLKLEIESLKKQLTESSKVVQVQETISDEEEDLFELF